MKKILPLFITILLPFMAQAENLDKDCIDEFFRVLDTNKDGEVSFGEYQAYIKTLSQRPDKGYAELKTRKFPYLSPLFMEISSMTPTPSSPYEEYIKGFDKYIITFVKHPEYINRPLHSVFNNSKTSILTREDVEKFCKTYQLCLAK